MYAPNETVTITLERFMNMQKGETEEKQEIARLTEEYQQLERQYDRLDAMLERIGEVAAFQDFAQYAGYQEAYEGQMDKIKKILGGGN